MKTSTVILLISLAVCIFLAVPKADAVYTITAADIVATTQNEIGSGNGTLDLILFTESAGGANNSAGGFNGDNANTSMPTGNAAGSDIALGSYITSIDEIRDFYTLNFSDGMGGSTVKEIILFVDLNQIKGKSDVSLDGFKILSNYTQNFSDVRDNPLGNDITSALQNSTGDGYTGGTVISILDSPKTLPLNEPGAGWADYIVHTEVNPFSPALDNARLLFNWESSGHNGGGETVFLSGTYATEVPEPDMIAMFVLGSLLLISRRRAK